VSYRVEKKIVHRANELGLAGAVSLAVAVATADSPQTAHNEDQPGGGE
jgi:hypothetical protein